MPERQVDELSAPWCSCRRVESEKGRRLQHTSSPARARRLDTVGRLGRRVRWCDDECGASSQVVAGPRSLWFAARAWWSPSRHWLPWRLRKVDQDACNPSYRTLKGAGSDGMSAKGAGIALAGCIGCLKKEKRKKRKTKRKSETKVCVGSNVRSSGSRFPEVHVVG